MKDIIKDKEDFFDIYFNEKSIKSKIYTCDKTFIAMPTFSNNINYIIDGMKPIFFLENKKNRIMAVIYDIDKMVFKNANDWVMHKLTGDGDYESTPIINEICYFCKNRIKQQVRQCSMEQLQTCEFVFRMKEHKKNMKRHRKFLEEKDFICIKPSYLKTNNPFFTKNILGELNFRDREKILKNYDMIMSRSENVQQTVERELEQTSNMKKLMSSNGDLLGTINGLIQTQKKIEKDQRRNVPWR